MIRADQQAHQVRHHQADKADHPGRRHRRADTQRRAKHQFPFQPLDRDAQVARLGFTEQQGIQRLGAARQPQRHGQRHQQQRPQPRIAGTVEAAEVPEGQGA